MNELTRVFSKAIEKPLVFLSEQEALYNEWKAEQWKKREDT